MLDPIVDLLNDNTPITTSSGKAVVIVGLFLAAFLVSRVVALVGRHVLAWNDARHGEATGDIRAGRRRETLVRVVRAAFSFAAYTTAIVLSIGLLVGGVDRLSALAGVSFVLVVSGFAVNRVLPDVVAGFFMISERWYSVGDTIQVPIVDIEGVVEDISLRRTKLRALNGDVINLHNSQIAAARVFPRGVRQHDLELYVSDEAEARELVADVIELVPVGPTTFVTRPWLREVEQLGDDLTRISVRTTVAAGRDWLVDRFLVDLLTERAREGLIVHGPVAFWVDETATRTFARSTRGARD